MGVAKSPTHPREGPPAGTGEDRDVLPLPRSRAVTRVQGPDGVGLGRRGVRRQRNKHCSVSVTTDLLGDSVCTLHKSCPGSSFVSAPFTAVKGASTDARKGTT